MAKINIPEPEKYLHKTKIKVRVTDINYGGHLGNDALLGLIHEARLDFLAQEGFSELNCGGAGLIMRNVLIEFKNEAFLHDELEIQIGISEPSKVGFDLIYNIIRPKDEKIISRVLTGMIFFDYEVKKIRPMPTAFHKAYLQE